MVDLGFLSFRKEEAILDGVKKHLDIVRQSVQSFSDAVGAAARGDRGATAQRIEEVLSKETEADAVHRELSLKIAEGAFFGGVREDFLNLLETIDNIADSAKDAVRFLSSDSALSEEGRAVFQSESMEHFLANLRSACDALKALIASFDRGKKEILSRVHAVEEYEEEADSDKDALLKELFGRAGSMSAVSVIQLRDFVFMADNIADNAEDASDVILVLVAKGYG
jgi:predicted phosphate transport protein (TIGR00153 family)